MPGGSVLQRAEVILRRDRLHQPELSTTQKAIGWYFYFQSYQLFFGVKTGDFAYLPSFVFYSVRYFKTLHLKFHERSTDGLPCVFTKMGGWIDGYGWALSFRRWLAAPSQGFYISIYPISDKKKLKRACATWRRQSVIVWGNILFFFYIRKLNNAL